MFDILVAMRCPGSLTRCVMALVGSLALSAYGQVNYERLRSFGFSEHLGDAPKAGVIGGGDGWLYGTTVLGGATDNGTVFRIREDGTGYVTLHQFSGTNGDGSHPASELLLGTDGQLYGTTYDAGLTGAGTIFKINRDGSGHAVLVSLNSGTQGAQPQAALIEGTDGKLYGTAKYGGGASLGTIFRLDKSGSGFEVLHTFAGGSADGSQPLGALLRGRDAFYGTTSAGGSAGAGTAFRFNLDGTGFTLLRSFSAATDGQGCCGALIEGNDHALYGVARNGGSYGAGTLFRMDTTGASLSVLHHFGQANDGQNPYVGVIQGSDGGLYGTTFTGGNVINGTVYRINTDGTGYTNLHHFDGGVSDGYRAQGTLWQHPDGALYGTTAKGGLANIGALFKLSPDGASYARLYSFNHTGGDATGLYANVIEASDGALYGLGNEGGAHEAGALYKMNADGTSYAILHDFSWETDDGSNPYGPLLEASDGLLYSTTGYGGGTNQGTIFRIDKQGNGYTILHRFLGVPGGGAYPSAGLIEGSDGKLYGRTISGGDNDGATVFRLNKDGTGFTIVHSFTDNGGYLYSPDPGLVEGADGALYSTTYGDGAAWSGTAWKINKDGTSFKVLHTFSSGGGDGYYPDGGLLPGSDGVFYGTTTYGGTLDSGTVFKVNPDGSGYAVLHSFNPTNSEGYWPRGDLIEPSGGVLLGVTYVGGLNDGGTVYALAKDGSRISVLHQFRGAEGANPIAGLGRGRSGTLYGTTYYGADLGLGSVFRMRAFQIGGGLSPNGFRVTVTGVPGQIYAVEAANALPPVWQHIGWLTNLTGTAELIDPIAGTTQRWYRAGWLLP